MVDYETLDFIADLFNPVLFGAVIGLNAYIWRSRQYTMAVIQTVAILLGAFLAYGWMLIDEVYGIWVRLGFDYSTHTATSLVMSLYIGYFFNRLRHAVFVLFVLYVLLMIIQEYHSFWDIAVTGVFIAVQYVGLLYWLIHRHVGKMES